jgi:protein SCO1/2
MTRRIFLIALATLGLGCHSQQNKTLPIYGNRQAVSKTVNGQTETDTVYQTIPAFKFVNQYGDSITNKSLDGQIYVADFFFTSCPSICPVMQRNLLKVYQEFRQTGGVKIISHTIDPQHDSVPVLKKYAEKLGVSGNMWWFLQGKKDDTYRIAEKSYFVAVKADNATPGGYIHQGFFVLIDKQKRIRGSYDGTDAKQVDQLIADIKTLRSEPDQTIAQ